PFVAADIGDVGRPGFISLAGPDSYTINGAGQNVASGTDALFYVYRPLAGDGQMTVRLTGLQLFWDNRAGIMIRESLAPDSRYVSLVSRPSESRKGTNPNGVNEGAEFKIKDTPGGAPRILAALDLKLPNWLRLVRAGNTFTAFVSPDGTTWTPLGSTSLAV